MNYDMTKIEHHFDTNRALEPSRWLNYDKMGYYVFLDTAPVSLILGGGVFKHFVIFTPKIGGKWLPNFDGHMFSIEVVENHQVGIDPFPTESRST